MNQNSSTRNWNCLEKKEFEQLTSGIDCSKVLVKGSNTFPKLIVRQEFCQIILNAYPKLQGIGGFELLRCKAATRDLELKPSLTCHSLRLLRSSIKSNSSKVYICPIQIDIEIVIKEDHPPVSHLLCTHLKHLKLAIHYATLLKAISCLQSGFL